MKTRIITLLAISMLCTAMSCRDHSLKRAEEKLKLQEQLNELIQIAESVSCDESTNWAFVAVGHKPCGGPTQYIAYPLSINTASFLDKVENYTKSHQAFNRRWDVSSDCAFVVEPSEITCVDNKAVLVY